MQNRGYDQNWLEELKRRNDIVSVVSEYIQLEQKGRNFWGCCPFHHEKTPSFCVNREDGLFHCFGCKEGGDVIKFVEKIESCDFIDAVKILADKVKMEIPEWTGGENLVAVKKQRDKVLRILDETYKHYVENLYLKEAKKAQDYIRFRGFTRRELEDFKMGYSLSWTEMVDYLRKKGFKDAELVEAGVCQTKNSHTYDVMAERLVFPIFNTFNECIGFSARALEKTDMAKYKNTAETIVFQKGKVVFGINLLKKYKQEVGLNEVILVEGQIDVIAMHRAGFRQTVACMGTALTIEHARELKRFTTNAVLCFDGDEAGTKATLRSIDILKEVGFNVRIATLPEGKDPDEILKGYGKEYLQKLIDNSLPVMDYYLEVEKKKVNLSTAAGKGNFVKKMFEHLRKFSLDSEKEPYLEKIKQLTNIPIDVLRRDLFGVDKSTKIPDKKEKQEETVVVRENSNIKALKFILASLLHNKEYINQNLDYNKLIIGQNQIMEIINSKMKLSSIYDNYEVEENSLLKDIIHFDFELFKGFESKYFNECVWIIAEEILKNKQQSLNDDFKKCEDLNLRKNIAKDIAEISKKLKQKSLEDFYDRR